ncbi:MAG: hypothetical protein WD739_13945 [Actinomycetota bacterium]
MLGATKGVSTLRLRDRLLLTRSRPLTDRDLVMRAVVADLGHDGADATGWPAAEYLVPYYMKRYRPSGFVTSLPQDPGVLVGDVAALADVEFDAVVSLCRMGTHDVPHDFDHLEVWLVDDDEPAVNPNLAFVLRDVAETIANFRDEDKRVELLAHLVQALAPVPGRVVACDGSGQRRGDVVEQVATLVGVVDHAPVLLTGQELGQAPSGIVDGRAAQGGDPLAHLAEVAEEVLEEPEQTRLAPLLVDQRQVGRAGRAPRRVGA